MRSDSRDDKHVLAHLKAENEYVKAVLSDTEGLQTTIFKEMKGRIQETDQSAPLRKAGYYYYSRTVQGQQYRIHCRRRLPPSQETSDPRVHDTMSLDEREVILLDENKAASSGGHKFYMTSGIVMSPAHTLMAWGEDTTGNEMYTLRVRCVDTGRVLTTKPIPNTSGSVAWASDNKTLFYVTKDKLDRPDKVWKHVLGTDPKDDVLVFHESDDAFYVGIHRDRSGEMIMIHAGSAITSYVQYIPADKPNTPPRVVLPKVQDVEYDASYRGGSFWVLRRTPATPNSEVLVCSPSGNDGGGDGMRISVAVPHDAATKIEDILVSSTHLCVFKRNQGLQGATAYKLGFRGLGVPSLPLTDGLDFNMPEEAYELSAGAQGDFTTSVLRLVYTSLTTPTTWYDADMNTGEIVAKKETPVLGGFDRKNYMTKRIWTESHDGVKVPMSILYRKDRAKLDGSDPLLLDAYGAYEISNDPWFDHQKLSLVDRGFTFAIAHVRGGGEMGRHWYEHGKYLKKKNTFYDVIACAEHLIKTKYTSA